MFKLLTPIACLAATLTICGAAAGGNGYHWKYRITNVQAKVLKYSVVQSTTKKVACAFVKAHRMYGCTFGPQSQRNAFILTRPKLHSCTVYDVVGGQLVWKYAQKC